MDKICDRCLSTLEPCAACCATSQCARCQLCWSCKQATAPTGTELVRWADEPQLPEAVESELQRLRERFWRYAQASTSANTQRSYRRSWTAFVDWCNGKGLSALPAHPETVAWYAIELANNEAGRKGPLKVSSILVELAAISHAHAQAKLPPPTRDPYLRVILRGLRREHGVPASAADPLMPGHIRAMIACLKPGLTGIRDLALLTFGLASGLRRIELATLQLSQLRFRREAHGEVYEVTLPRSKADQAGAGHVRLVHPGRNLDTCPVSALTTWLAAASIRDGYVFRKVVDNHVVGERLNERTVDAVVRAYVEDVRKRLPHAIPEGRYSAHSLRAGCATMLHLAGKSDLQIRDHIGHTSLSTTARYVRLAKLGGSSATKDVGL